jgi:uncharacterized protein (DUF736 family)
MINLNDESFDKVGGSIFNGGVAGIVENVTVTLEKKKPEDKEGSPDYKVIFTDSSGASCNTPFWYVKEATQYKSVEQQVLAQGKVLKHLVHALHDPTYVFPSFETAEAMLNGCMKIIRDSLNPALKFRIFANYGSTSSIKKFLQPRSWVPFIEPQTVPISETRLKVGNLDQMVQIKEDAPETTAAATTDDWE